MASNQAVVSFAMNNLLATTSQKRIRFESASSSEDGLWGCLGCQRDGNGVSFLQKMHFNCL